MSADSFDTCKYENICVDLPGEGVKGGRIGFIGSEVYRLNASAIDTSSAAGRRLAARVARHAARLRPTPDFDVPWMAADRKRWELTAIDYAFLDSLIRYLPFRPRIVPFSSMIHPFVINASDAVAAEFGGTFQGAVTWVDVSEPFILLTSSCYLSFCRTCGLATTCWARTYGAGHLRSLSLCSQPLYLMHRPHLLIRR
jgi:hypothetical protein